MFMQCTHDAAPAHGGKTIVQRCRGVGRIDQRCFLQQDIPRIESGIHLHDRDAGFAVAGNQCALYRCGAAPARQQ